MRQQAAVNPFADGELSPEQVEALAKVAALSATRGGDDGPSRAMISTAVALAILVVSMLLLAAVVSIGPGG